MIECLEVVTFWGSSVGTHEM